MNAISKAETGHAHIVGGSNHSAKGPGPEVMAASTLQGDDVFNTAGEKLGSIQEIMIDVPNGRVAYAVLSRGGLLGLGEKLYAIPWSSLTMNADSKCFILDVEKERLDKATGLDKHNWPSMADERWARDLHDYYGQDVYW